MTWSLRDLVSKNMTTNGIDGSRVSVSMIIS